LLLNFILVAPMVIKSPSCNARCPMTTLPFTLVIRLPLT